MSEAMTTSWKEERGGVTYIITSIPGEEVECVRVTEEALARLLVVYDPELPRVHIGYYQETPAGRREFSVYLPGEVAHELWFLQRDLAPIVAKKGVEAVARAIVETVADIVVPRW